jgi:hypothetical protein
LPAGTNVAVPELRMGCRQKRHQLPLLAPDYRKEGSEDKALAEVLVKTNNHERRKSSRRKARTCQYVEIEGIMTHWHQQEQTW